MENGPTWAGIDLGPIIALAPASWHPIIQAIIAVVGVCATLAAILPHAADPTSTYGRFRAVIDILGANWGNAKNAPTLGKPNIHVDDGSLTLKPRDTSEAGFAKIEALLVAAFAALTLGACAQFVDAWNKVDTALADPKLKAAFETVCKDGQVAKAAVWRGVDLLEKVGVKVPDAVDVALTQASSDFDGLCALGLPADATEIPGKIVAAVQVFKAVDAQAVAPAVSAVK